MTTLLRRLACTAAIMVAGSVSYAESHMDPAIAGAIAARKAHMGLQMFNLGILGNMAQEKIPYDADAAQAAADNLVAIVGMNQSAYWPQGSDSESVEGTRALPAIWEDFPGVMEKVGALQAATAEMQSAAGTGLDGIRGAMGAVGGACNACHEAYRQPRN